MLSGGQNISAFGGATSVETQMRQSLERWANTHYNNGWQGINDWTKVYNDLRNTSNNMIDSMLRDKLKTYAGVTVDPTKNIVESFGSQSAVGRLLVDLDTYISRADTVSDPDTVHSVALARLMRRNLLG